MKPPNSNFRSILAAIPEDGFIAAAGAQEPPVYQLRHLSPTPPGLRPEYDYAALLDSLVKAVGLSDTSPFAESQILPQDRKGNFRWRPSCRARLISSSGFEELTEPHDGHGKSKLESTYEQIQNIRHKLTGKTHDGTHVLVVDEISRDFLQIVGAAIDLDPTFLWRHYNEELDGDDHVPGMATMKDNFLALVKGASRSSSQVRTASATAERPVESLTVALLKLENGEWRKSITNATLHLSFSSTERVHRASRERRAFQGLEDDEQSARQCRISSRISCYRVSPNRCGSSFL